MIKKYLLLAGLAYAGVMSSVAQTWTPANIPAGDWSSPVYSTNGDKAFAVSRFYGIYASTNYGLDWTRTSAPQTNWTSLACSADGSEVVATVSKNENDPPWGNNIPGHLYISRDSGMTWNVANAPLANWSSVACSFDGKILLAASGDGWVPGPLYVSTDSGVTWAPSSLTSYQWGAVAMSGDGQSMYAKLDGGGMTFVSTNTGVTWVPGDVPASLFGLSDSSADGMHQVGFQVCGSLLTSDDAGTNWTVVPDSIGLWQAVAASPNGAWRLAVDGSTGARVSYVPESAPFFVRQPIASTNLTETMVVTLKAAALGSGPIVYQWQHNGTNLTDDARITGSTNVELTITNLVVADSGNYLLVASNYLGMTNSEMAAVTVNADDQKPLVQIYSPAPHEKVVGAGFSVFGGASDNSYVTGVWCRLNGGSWFVPRTSDGWQNWGADIWPTNGLNVFSVYAVDSVGNISFTNSVAFKAEVQGKLYVVSLGNGKVKSAQNNKYLDLGSVCRISGVPDKGYLFSGWSGDLQSADATASFKLTNSMNIAATFVPNPFPAVKGKYEGPIDSLIPSLNGPGSIQAQVLANGSFVLKLELVGGKRKYHYSGKFAPDGTASFQPELPLTVNLQLDLNGGNTLTVTVSYLGDSAVGWATKQSK